jgi:hypothetical protein
MPQAGSTFTDWQQVEKDSLLFIDDFDWSEPPRRGRRRITGRCVESEPLYGSGARHVDERYAEDAALERSGSWDQPTAAHSHFDEMMEEWNAAYGRDADDDFDDRAAERAFDLSDPGDQGAAQGARRTVLITGRGDERYLPAPRQHRSSGLRFHERSGFSPDRGGLWAVLLGIALVIGCIAH